MQFVLAVLILLATGLVSAQDAPRRPGAVAGEEAALVSEGWAALVARDLATAGQRARTALARYPRSLPALQLSVEVEIEQRGAVPALDVYEQWLGSRTVEDPFVLRRIAHAILREVATTSRDPLARLTASAALAADGDQAAVAALDEAVKAGSRAEVELLTRRGNEAAVGRAVEALRTPVPNKMALIDAVGQSGNQQGIPALIALLQDPRPEHRAAAAEALGRLGARQALPQIRAMLGETMGPPIIRMAAAGALLRLGDESGVETLRLWLGSPVPGMRAGAAKGLAPRPDAAWAQTVRALADESDPTIRLEAAQLLAATDPTAARVTLDRLLTDADPAVRELAGSVAAGADVLATDSWSRLRALLRVGTMARVRAADRLLERTR